MFLLPDTPRWYYAKGRTEEGDSVLCRLHDLPLDDIKVQVMKQEILTAIEMESMEASKFNVLELFWDNSDLRAGRRIRIAFLLLLLQTLMGKLSTALPLLLADLHRNQHDGLLQHSHLLQPRLLSIPIRPVGGSHEHPFGNRDLLPPSHNRTLRPPPHPALVRRWLHSVHADLRDHDLPAEPDSRHGLDSRGLRDSV